MKYIIYFLIIVISFSCEQSRNDSNDKIKIVVTTNIIKDAVKNVVGDQAKVSSLMGPGVDPHLYKATQGDLTKLSSADIVFYNGLHLEGKMGEVFKKLGKQKRVLPVSMGIPDSLLIRVPQFNDNYDPHVWLNIRLWKWVIIFIRDCMVKYDKQNADVYKKNTASYILKLDELDQYVYQQISTIPKKQRVLITAHDAFGYFSKAYDIQVYALQGISTLSEYGLKDVTDLVNFVIKNNIKSVFVETSVSSRSINAVIEGCMARGVEVELGGSLYSDALGKEGTPQGEYIGMIKSNTKTIVEGLR